jgi:ligand-binding SRPBCC domain-containing protein
MTRIQLFTKINAPIERCFDLSRSIDLHVSSTWKTKERAVAGRKNGLIEKGETVTWEATHFGVKQRLTTRIVEMNPPHYFSDEMTAGIFKSMYHEHRFEAHGQEILMNDDFCYETPYGILGWIFNLIILKRHLTTLLQERNEMIRNAAEGNKWRDFLN